MKTKLLAAIGCLPLFCGLASAQSYAIRVTFNTNLRAAASLQANIIETADSGTTLNVVSELNRWLRISRNGNEVWMASWVGHTRVESNTQTQTSTQTTSNIDNCCFVDRLCTTDQEWTDGYWAYQNNQSGAPTQSQTQTSTQPASVDPGQTDNCCFLGWQCNTDEDWINGYQAYQNTQCDTSSPQTSSLPVTDIPAGIDNCCRVNRQCNSDEDWIRGWLAFEHFQCNLPSVTQVLAIQGGAGFVSQITDALHLLRETAPQWWKYATSGLDRIVQDLSSDVPGVYVERQDISFRLYQ